MVDMEDKKSENISSVSQYIDEVLEHACKNQVSDIHIDPGDKNCRIQIRIAGQLLSHGTYAKIHHEEIVGRIKILSKLRTDIHDKSQDGRFFFETIPENRDVTSKADVRVSILPTFYGENVVLRILRPDLQRDKKLVELGFSSSQAEIVQKYIAKDQGIIVIAGPTGSGKTTTIYALVALLTKTQKNIVTIEDPVEYVIAGVRQVQVSEASDFGFAKALRAILRQDPDVIILGEIRDTETAKLAFQASLTGHLVITTIHAEDSAGVYSRLTDLGVSREMMHSLALMISQRLIRIDATDTGQSQNKSNENQVSSRMGIFEVIPVEGKTKVTLFQNTFPEYIRTALRKQGVLLLEDSLSALYERAKDNSSETHHE